MNWWKVRFALKKTFAKCSLVLPKDTTSPNLAEKTFVNSHKTLKLAKVFSLKSFPLYSIKNPYSYGPSHHMLYIPPRAHKNGRLE